MRIKLNHMFGIVRCTLPNTIEWNRAADTIPHPDEHVLSAGIFMRWLCIYVLRNLSTSFIALMGSIQ